MFIFFFFIYWFNYFFLNVHLFFLLLKNYEFIKSFYSFLSFKDKIKMAQRIEMCFVICIILRYK